MPTLAVYERFRALWGLVDWQAGTDSPYTTAQTGPTLGSSAAAGVGVGVRRCIMVWDRQGIRTGLDPAEGHFDFLNLTGGVPDDTWTSTDYSTLEGFLDTFWGAIKGAIPAGYKLTAYEWYRHGPGIVPPNPAERVTSRSVVALSGGNALPPQVASTVTLKTGVRRSWGRTYLPACSDSLLTADGAFNTSSWVNVVGTAAGALLASAVGADFPIVVTSNALNAVLNVEGIEVDNTPDIIRRRRFKSPTARKILP